MLGVERISGGVIFLYQKIKELPRGLRGPGKAGRLPLLSTPPLSLAPAFCLWDPLLGLVCWCQEASRAATWVRRPVSSMEGGVSARPPGAPAVCPPPPSPCGARSPDPAESGVSAGQGVCIGGRRGWDSAPLLMEGLGSKGRLRSQKAWNPGVGEPPLIRIPEGLTHDAFLLTAHTRPSSCRRWKERGIFGPGVEMVALSGQLSLTAV